MTSIVIRKPNSQAGSPPPPVTGRMRFTPMRHFDAAKNLVIAGRHVRQARNRHLPACS